MNYSYIEKFEKMRIAGKLASETLDELTDFIKQGISTDQIDKFTEKGILLKSGKEIITDIIITATGLNLEMLSNINLTVDNKPIDISQTITYKGMMYSGIPNFASTFGYTNASWTLGADLTSEYVTFELSKEAGSIKLFVFTEDILIYYYLYV